MTFRIQILGLLACSALFVDTADAEMPTKIPPDKERGEALYRELCVGCHGPQALGKGLTAESFGWQAQDMALAGRYDNDDFDEAIRIIQMGQKLMPAYEQQIDRHETKRILVWLKDLDPEKGAPLPPLDEDAEPDEVNDASDGTAGKADEQVESKPVNGNEESNSNPAKNSPSEISPKSEGASQPAESQE